MAIPTRLRKREDRRSHALASASVLRVALVWPGSAVSVSMRSLGTDRSLGKPSNSTPAPSIGAITVRSRAGRRCRCRIERGGLVGPHLTVLIAFMKGGLPRIVFDDPEVSPRCVGVTLARSTLANTINKVSEALEGTYEELLRMLPGARRS